MALPFALFAHLCACIRLLATEVYSCVNFLKYYRWKHSFPSAKYVRLSTYICAYFTFAEGVLTLFGNVFKCRFMSTCYAHTLPANNTLIGTVTSTLKVLPLMFQITEYVFSVSRTGNDIVHGFVFDYR